MFQLILTVTSHHHDDEEAKESARSSVAQRNSQPDTDRDSFPDIVANFYARQHGREIEAGVVELCFSTEKEMDQWHSSIVGAS